MTNQEQYEEMCSKAEMFDELLADVKELVAGFEEDAEFCDDHDVEIVDVASAAKSLEWKTKAAVYRAAARSVRMEAKKYGEMTVEDIFRKSEERDVLIRNGTAEEEA